MTPPKYLTGKHIRWIFLLGILSYFLYFIVHGIISDSPSSRVVYICDTGNDVELQECQGLDDVATCAELTDADGNAATCIESSCGYKLFPHIDISIAGSSDPYDPDAATSTTSFATVCSVIYSLLPYLMAFLYLVLFLASGNFVPLTRLVVFAFISVMNEGIFKHLIKQNRPEGSCLYFKSYGMPR